ncbi:abnormal spindle microcephaly-associated protein [Biomphalaria glabrata]|nr:abnormal spindle microcephaly-associated protein [Biomphalaria glabrata]
MDSPAHSSRKSRRSWFDAPPLTSLEPPPVALNACRKRLSEDAVETLLLTHFTKPPKINFSKIVLGKTKLRTLQVRNPHDYEQEVVIEKFPFKKKFTVNATRFKVEPGGLFCLEILWTPEETGGFREMVQFQVNQCFRLQAFLIGIVEAPKLPRKDNRAQRRQGFGPRVKEPATVIQTSALTLIKSNYSPRRSHDVYEEWMTTCENKENTDILVHSEDRQTTMMTQDTTIAKENLQLTAKADLSVLSKTRTVIPKEEMKTPTPLESTVITTLQDKNLVILKNNRKQWRNISDITTPTLNTMSPIPRAEDNDHGLTLDSYFQPNDTGLGKATTSNSDNAVSVCDLKRTFVLPAPPVGLPEKLKTTKNCETVSKELKHLPCAPVSVQNAEAEKANYIHHVTQESLKESTVSPTMSKVLKKSDWASPKRITDLADARTSPASPRTMLNQSLSLISQMKLHKGSSPEESDDSVNCSVISLGKGIVSPNSFLADMKSMRLDRSAGSGKSQNTSTPLIPSPLSIMNNSIPHSVMVSHLANIRSSLSSPLLCNNFTELTPRTKDCAIKHGLKAHSPSKFKVRQGAKMFSKSPQLKVKYSPKSVSPRSKALQRKALMRHESSKKGSRISPQQSQDLVQKRKVMDEKKRESSEISSEKSSIKNCSVVKVKSKKRSPKIIARTTVLTKKKKKLTTNPESRLKTNTPVQSSCESLIPDFPVPLEVVPPHKSDSILERDTYQPHKSESFCESFFQNEESGSCPSSVTKWGKFFPDINLLGVDVATVTELSEQEELIEIPIISPDGTVADQHTSTSEFLVKSKDLHHQLKETASVSCQNSYRGATRETSTSGIMTIDGKLLMAAQAAQQSVSPQKFCAISPSLLPTSPGMIDAHLRRGTMTVTKSRPSDALLAAMNRRRPLDENPRYFNDDDTETNEKINVRVEERYEEIDGQMFLVVKETTDVVKSITETYVEHIASSPNQFLTPVRLPQMSVASALQMSALPSQLDRHMTSPSQFLTPIHLPPKPNPKMTMPDTNATNQLPGVSPSQFLTPIHLPDNPESQFSRRSTHVIRSPKVLKLTSEDKKLLNFGDSIQTAYLSEKPLGSMATLDADVKVDDTLNQMVDKQPRACVKQLNLVEYNVCSDESSSVNCTQDSLEASPLSDSLNRSSSNRSTSLTEASELKSGQRSYTQKETAEVDSELVPVHPSRHGDEESEENFYDTVSENYYDALSDTANDPKTVSGPSAEPTMSNDSITVSQNSELKGDTIVNVNSDSTCLVADNRGTSHPVKTDKRDHPMSCSEENLPRHNLTSESDLKSSCQKEILLENGIDHVEHFMVITKETFDVPVAEMETLMASADYNEISDRKHLRRSVSLSILDVEQNMEKASHFKHTTQSYDIPNESHKTKVTINHSNMFAQPSQKEAQKMTIKTRSQTNLSTLKHRSQSLTTLSKEVKSPKKVKPDSTAAVKKEQKIKTFKQQNNQLNLKLASKQKTLPKGVAQSKLILVKKPKAGMARHPMPFAARNMYYDERWIEKQERGFSYWLNYVLTPPDEYLTVTTKPKVDAGFLSLDSRQVVPRLAPTKEVLSFRAYAARRRLNRLRRCACELYQSEPVVNIICKIEVEVESRRLAPRKDKMIHADLGVKQRLLDLLLQYSPLWLRIGLETIFGEVLMLQSNQDVVGLSRFIIMRLLASPDIASEFAHPTVPHLYKEGFAAALARHTIKKFLLLVYFLDQAKTSRLIDHDPCLFCKDAEVKSSKEILIQFSREVLSGEGDLTRHLAYLGYIVNHVQKPIDEFDFAVKNLSSDLRDGLRLSRVLELLADNKEIMKKVRTPAISRLQKIHNMEAFFKAMNERKFDLTSLQVSPRDVVDGHREKTLLLLWHLIMHFQSSIHVNMEHLKEEIHLLIKSLRLKLAMQKIGAIATEECLARRDSGETKLVLDNEGMKLIFQWCRLVCLHYGVKVENFTVSFSDGRALCCLIHHYHPALLPLSDIKFQTTVSFQEEAEDQSPLNNDLDCSMDWNGGGMVPNENDPEFFEQLLQNEKSNFKVLYDKLSELGGVPLMLRSSDMSNTIPDEKVVSTCISYLCGRLLDIREEVKAARIVQMAWRRRKLNRAIKQRQVKTQAANTIQRWIKPILAKRLTVRQEAAATCLQKYVRGYLARMKTKKLQRQQQASKIEIMKLQAAQTLQSYWRTYTARIQLAKLKEKKQLENRQKLAATCLQKYVRCHLAKLKVQELRRQQEARKMDTMKQQAAQTLQNCWRCYAARRELASLREMKQLKQQEIAAVCLQKYVRRHQAQLKAQQLRSQLQASKQSKMREQAAKTLQNCWRSHIARKKLVLLRRMKQLEEDRKKQETAATIAQKCVKGWLQRRTFLKEKTAIVTLQAACRQYLAQRLYKRYRLERHNKNATIIQKWVRCYLCSLRYSKLKMATVTIQKNWRILQAKKELHRLRTAKQNKSAVIIQNFVRQKLQEKRYQSLKSAAIVLQSYWRVRCAKNILMRLKAEKRHNSAIIVQSVILCVTMRRRFLKQKSSAIVIQKHWRRILAFRVVANLREERHREVLLENQRKLTQRTNAALVLQTHWKKVLAMRKLSKMKLARDSLAAIVIQKYWRGFKARKMFSVQNYCATKIQNYWRMILAQRNFKILVARRNEQAAVTVQSAWRKMFIRQKFLEMKRAAILIQSYWRMYSASQKYMRERQAVLILQHWHKANMMARQQRFNYSLQQQAAITIQKSLRSWYQRKEFLKQRNAAVVIQSNFRCFRRKLKYQAMKLAAIIIQRGFRHYALCKKERNEYLTCKKAAVTIQRNWRKVMKQKQLKYFTSAIVIQSVYRKYSARKEYLSQRNAALKIQGSYKAYIIGKNTRQDFLMKKQAILVLQSYFRMFLCHRAYLTMKYAAIVLQTHYRAKREGQIYRENFLLKRRAACIIQKWYRQLVVRRRLQVETLVQHLAAVKLQATYRGWSQRQDYLLFRAATVCIQRRFRAKLLGQTTRLEFKEMKQSALIIQRSWRIFLCRAARKKLIAELEERLRLTEQMQLQEKLLRLAEEERQVKELQEKHCYEMEQRRCRAAIVLQRHFRLFLVRKESVKVNLAATVIQKYIRCYLARRNFLILKRHVTKLQRLVRRKQLMERERSTFLKMRKSIVIIQTAIRLWLTSRQVLKQKSVLRIQTFWRMYRERAAFCQASSAVLVLKSFMELKQQQIEQQIKHLAARSIQRTYRYHLHKKALRKNAAALVIQRAIKTFLLKKRIERHQAACVLQRTFRIIILRKRLHVMSAAVKIQSFFKMVLARRRYDRLQKSVLFIQASLRTWLVRRHMLLVKKREVSAVCIQSAVRGWLTRRRVTHALQERLQKIHLERLKNKSALILQSLWRGYKVRRDIKNTKIVKARKKVQKATLSATRENTLGARTTSALDFLLQVKDLAQILEALIHLEYATRLSPVCCLQIIEVNAVSVLFRLISSCNRSVPHMELIRYSICILLNLAKCERTLNDVLQSDDNISVLLDMLQIYRDKGPIFLNTCMLLGILGLNEHRKQRIVQHPQLVERLQSIYALTQRKHKASQTRELAKVKQAALKSCNSSLLLTTPSAKKKVTKATSMQKIIPKSIKEFDNPLVALNFLMNVLGIEKK